MHYDHCAYIYIQKLNILQRKAIRVIAGVEYRASSHIIFTKLKLLNINQIRNCQIAELFYCFEHAMLPMSYANYFAKASMTHKYHTRGAHLYRPKKFARILELLILKHWDHRSGILFHHIFRQHKVGDSLRFF